MIDNILLFLSYLIVLFIGYFFGSKREIPDLRQYLPQPKPQSEVGVIRRPSVEELNKRNEPDIIREGKQAVKQTLDLVPDLKKAKDFMDKMKQYEH